MGFETFKNELNYVYNEPSVLESAKRRIVLRKLGHSAARVSNRDTVFEEKDVI